MKTYLTKISLILGITFFIASCDVVKRVPEGKYLLTDNTVRVDGEEIKDFAVTSQLTQTPNPKIPIIGVPLGLHIYNIAEASPDSTFQDWLHRKPNREKRLVNFLSKKQVIKMDSSKVKFNNWLKRTGDAPVIISQGRTNKSIQRLKNYYKSFGYFNTEATAKVVKNEKKEKRAKVVYDVKRYQPYILDSINTTIASPIIDSLFRKTRNNSFLKKGQQYSATDVNNERDRLTIEFRNSGVYHFNQEYITFEADTNSTGHKANMTYIIPDRKITTQDSTIIEPFKIYNVNKVRIVTDYTFANKDREQFKDSTSINGYELYSYDKLKFKPKAITDAIAITPNAIFKDIDRTLTYAQISDLQIFKYPNISYQEDPSDLEGDGLIATILLTPREKYTFGADIDVYTSTIQQLGTGFSGSLFIRNVFRRAETLEISGRGSVGSSNDVTTSSKFFNVSEIGGDVKLSFPRTLAPFNTDKIIPKYMSPSTNISTGFGVQTNIGLDRQTINTIYNYSWKPKKSRNYSFDFINLQFVRNVNTDNYYNVYRSSYNRLNEIAREVNFDFVDNNINPVLQLPGGSNNFNEADFFIDNYLEGNLPNVIITEDLFREVRSIQQRQQRLTENNLIVSTNFTFINDTRKNLYDKEFTRLRVKLESAGSLLSIISSAANLIENDNSQSEILGVPFTQYGKIDAEIIKHWELNNESVFATRAFLGLAVPYGNSNSIPFTRSYFAGGANDNRGWRPYDLGPGSSGSVLDFNEANFKIALNAEYRFTILGSFKGGLFVDAGNIWNVFDDVEAPEFTFDGLEDLSELAVATGLGLRYDFEFFVFRIDTGFKTHDPSLPKGQRWFKRFNITDGVIQLGINYPF